MKKLSLLLVLSTLVVTGCGPKTTTTTPSVDGSEPSVTTPSVTTPSVTTPTTTPSTGSTTTPSVPDSESYQVIIGQTPTGVSVTSDKQMAKKGEIITITITITDDAYSVTSVSANTTIATKVNETTYTFVMPDNPVTVNVQLAVDGDVTLSGGLSGSFTKISEEKYVISDVVVTNDTTFDVNVKTPEGTTTKLGVSDVNRFKTFADVDYASGDDNFKLGGGAKYTITYDLSNPERPLSFERSDVTLLPNNAASLQSLFNGRIQSEDAVFPKNVSKVSYTNTLANESYTWQTSGFESLAEVTTLNDTNTVNAIDYVQLDNNILKVVDTYIPRTNAAYEKDYTLDDESEKYSGLYVINDSDENGRETDEVSFESKNSFTSETVGDALVNTYNHTMPSIDTDIMYAYRVGTVVEDSVTQADVTISSVDSSNDTFTTTLKTSKTLDSTGDTGAEISVKEHYEYRATMVFNKNGSLLTMNYVEKKYTEADWNFSSLSWITGTEEDNFNNNGTIVKQIDVIYEYNTTVDSLPAVSVDEYFVNAITNFEITNSAVESSKTANKLNLGDALEDYVSFDVTETKALNVWQYEVIGSSNTLVVNKDNPSKKWTAAAPGTSEIELGIVNGIGVVVSETVEVFSNQLVRDMYLNSHYGKFDENETFNTGTVIGGGSATFGLDAKSSTNKTMPLPLDLRAEVVGTGYGITSSINHSEGSITINATAATNTTTVKVTFNLITAFYDTSWVSSPKQLHMNITPMVGRDAIVGEWVNDEYTTDSIIFTNNQYDESHTEYDASMPYIGKIEFDGLGSGLNFSTVDFKYNYVPASNEFDIELIGLEKYSVSFNIDYNSETDVLSIAFVLNEWMEGGNVEEYLIWGWYEEGFPMYNTFTKVI